MATPSASHSLKQHTATRITLFYREPYRPTNRQPTCQPIVHGPAGTREDKSMSRKKQPIQSIREAKTPEQREKLIRKTIIDRYSNLFNNGDPRRAAQLLAEAIDNWLDYMEKPSSVFDWLVDNARNNGEISFISSDPSDVIYSGIWQLLGLTIPEEICPWIYTWATGPASRLPVRIITLIQKHLPDDLYMKVEDNKLRKRHGYIIRTKSPQNVIFKTSKK